VPQTVVLKQLNLVGSTSGRVVRNVEGATIHPKYDSFSMVNDVALIQLKEPIDNIEPIALAFPEDYKTGLETKALGWGTTSSGGSPSDVLRIVTVPLVSHSVCTARPSYPGEIDQATMICAGYPAGGKDSCQGDSGGPLMHQGTNGAAKLFGVVSWGEGCASKNKYGVYARVSAYHSWIKTTTKSEVDPEQPTDGPTDPGAPTSSPTLSPPPTDPLNGWEGWLVERNFCRKFKRTRCNKEPRCEFKKINGMARGARCYPSRAICLPE
jgi:secreted trypsin-like serine protease